jgi:hypothetical protein
MARLFDNGGAHAIAHHRAVAGLSTDVPWTGYGGNSTSISWGVPRRHDGLWATIAVSPEYFGR